MALDDISMWLAFKIFEIAQMADGQESSTRYITMDAANVPSAEELGVPPDLASRWRELVARGFAAYHAEYVRLDALAVAEPERVRLPEGAKPAVAARLRKITPWIARVTSFLSRRGRTWDWCNRRGCGRPP